MGRETERGLQVQLDTIPPPPPKQIMNRCFCFPSRLHVVVPKSRLSWRLICCRFPVLLACNKTEEGRETSICTMLGSDICVRGYHALCCMCCGHEIRRKRQTRCISNVNSFFSSLFFYDFFSRVYFLSDDTAGTPFPFSLLLFAHILLLFLFLPHRIFAAPVPRPSGPDCKIEFWAGPGHLQAGRGRGLASRVTGHTDLRTQQPSESGHV